MAALLPFQTSTAALYFEHGLDLIPFFFAPLQGAAYSVSATLVLLFFSLVFPFFCLCLSLSVSVCLCLSLFLSLSPLPTWVSSLVEFRVKKKIAQK